MTSAVVKSSPFLFDMRKFKVGLFKKRSGQMMLEYAIMFVVILLVIVYAATTFVKPSLCNLYNKTAGVFDTASNMVQNSLQAP